MPVLGRGACTDFRRNRLGERRIERVINRKTAKVIGVVMLRELWLRADEVIE